MRPPKRVHLPSGRVVALETRGQVRPRRRARAAPLFSELADLVEGGDVAVDIDLRALALRDFHALRALAMRFGWIEEEPIEIACCNCDAPIRLAPCASLALGPFVDGELCDPELDRTLDLAGAHDVEGIGSVKLRDVTAGEASALHRALRRRRLPVTDRVVRAMGIEAVGGERDPARIAESLSSCSDEAWGGVCDLFLRAHYPLRLASIAICGACGARNDVDAPYDREFEPSASGGGGSNAGAVFPDFDAFDARAREAFDRAAASDVMFVVEGAAAACDDGGVPLLGSYDPPVADPGVPSRAARVTVYYRTFRNMWDDEGAYDWGAELDETIAHELEHHEGWLAGHDPMDEQERDEIARERTRIVGRAAEVRAGVSAFGQDVRGFVARTWPIWLVVAAFTIAASVCGK